MEENTAAATGVGPDVTVFFTVGGGGDADFGFVAVCGEVVPVFAPGVDVENFADGDFIGGR